MRGMNPWPMAFFVRGEKKIKVLECRVAKGEKAAPGTVLSTKPLLIQCAEGAVELVKVTPEGGKPMAGEAWALGQRFAKGDLV